MRMIERAVGQLRLARGRCPRCASLPQKGCPTCHGYEGPFPPSEATRRRWQARFARAAGAPVAGDRGHPVAVWSSVH